MSKPKPFCPRNKENNTIVNQRFQLFFCRKEKKNLSVSKKVVLLHSHLRKKDWKMQTVR